MTRTPRRLTAALAALTTTAVLAGCGQGVEAKPAAQQSSGAVTLTNCDVSKTYPGTHERIVALNPGQADLLARLGAAKQIVGVAQTNGDALPASLTKDGHDVPVLSKVGPPTREKLLEARPDLVVSPTTYEFTGEKGYATQDQLTQAGAQTYVAAAGCFTRRSKAEVTDLLTDIDSYGMILHQEAKAAELRAAAEKQLQEAKTRAEGKQSPTLAQVFIEGDTVTAIGAGVEHSIGKAAGGTGVFTPSDPAFAKFFAAEVSRETLLAKDPDVIVFGTTSPAHEQQTRAWLTRHLPGAKAVRANRLVAIPSSQLLPGTWGNLDAVTTINKGLYPES